MGLLRSIKSLPSLCLLAAEVDELVGANNHVPPNQRQAILRNLYFLPDLPEGIGAFFHRESQA